MKKPKVFQRQRHFDGDSCNMPQDVALKKSTLGKLCTGKLLQCQLINSIVQIAIGACILHAMSSGIGFAQTDLKTEIDQREAQAAVHVRMTEARLVATKQATISAEMAGSISEILAPKGSRVNAGDILAKIKCSVPEARLAKAQSDLREAVAIRNSNQKLSDLNSVGTLEMALAAIRVEKSRAQLDDFVAQVERCILKAPFEGIIVDQFKEVGEYLKVGEPVVDLINPSELKVHFLAPTNWLKWLQPNTKFRFSSHELDHVVWGKVTLIGTRADPINRLIRLEGKLTDSFGPLMPGMTGRVHFNGGSE